MGNHTGEILVVISFEKKKVYIDIFKILAGSNMHSKAMRHPTRHLTQQLFLING